MHFQTSNSITHSNFPEVVPLFEVTAFSWQGPQWFTNLGYSLCSELVWKVSGNETLRLEM